MFVFGRPAGELARGDKERTTIAQRPLTALQRGLNQGRFHHVIIDIAQPGDLLIFEAELRVYPSRCHAMSPVDAPG